METDGHLTKYLDCMIFEQFTIVIQLVSISMDDFFPRGENFLLSQ